MQCGATGQSWLSSSAFQRSLSLWLECIFTLTWWWPDHGAIHPDSSHWFFSAEPLSSHCPYSAYRMVFLFSVPLLSSLYRHLLCVWAGEAASGGCVQVVVTHIPPWWAWVWRCLISGTLWMSCSCCIIRISEGDGGTGRGLEDSCLRCSELGPVSGINSGVVITPCRAVFTSSLHLWGINLGSLAVTIAE